MTLFTETAQMFQWAVEQWPRSWNSARVSLDSSPLASDLYNPDFRRSRQAVRIHNKSPSSFKKHTARCIHEKETTYTGRVTITPAKVEKPSPADMENCCEEAVRPGIACNAALQRRSHRCHGIGIDIRGECHSISSDIGDLTRRIE
jgi:hypothetical protein